MENRDSLNQLLMRLEILNLKIDSILDNIVLLKDYQKLNDMKILNLEKIINGIKSDIDCNLDNFDNQLKQIKVDTNRMNDHISFVENGMESVSKYFSIKNLNPLKSLSIGNMFKSIKENDKQLIERQINNDDEG